MRSGKATTNTFCFCSFHTHCSSASISSACWSRFIHQRTEVEPPILWILFHLFEADLMTTKDTLSLSAAAGNPLTCSFRSPCLRFSSDARRVIGTFYSCAFSADPRGFLTGRQFCR